MRPPLRLFAIAAPVALSLVHLAARADHGPPEADNADWTATRLATRLLADTGLGDEFRPSSERLASRLDVPTVLSLGPRERRLLLRYARNRFENAEPVARCWAPDTPIEILMAYHAVEEAARSDSPQAPAEGNDPGADPPPAPAMQFFRRWSATATDGSGVGVQGLPVTLTWSIVPDGTPIPGDPDIGDSAGPSTLRARLAEIYPGDTGPPETQPWFAHFQAVFDSISAQTGIRYRYEPNDDGQPLGTGSLPGQLGTRGDIRLGGHRIDGNGSTLAYNYFPNNGDMVIDTDDNWFTNTNNDSIRLRNTLEHEHGHGIGMEHVCPINNTKLMEPFINSNFRGIQFDEIYTLQRWYGDFLEHHGAARDNDTIANATPLAVVPGSPFAVQWLSIDDDSDTDFFAIPLPADSRLTARVLPSSDSYLEGPQNGNGTCSSGLPFDPSAHHDLGIELVAPDGSEVLAAANANPAGQPEEILSFTTPHHGVHYLKIAGDTSDRAQLYRLEIEIAAPAVSLALQSRLLVEESFAPRNGLVEPGESIEVELVLRNDGATAAEDVVAVLSGPDAFAGLLSEQDYGTIAPAQAVARNFVFGLAGNCGDTIPLALTITAAGSHQSVLPLEFHLGSLVVVLEESFDGIGSGLPAEWSSDPTMNGSGWSRTGTQISSPPNALFAEDVAALGTSSLVSPSVTLPGSGGTLRFRHLYDTEAYAGGAYDGGVLEISVNGAPWQDIEAIDARFAEGGYNRTIDSGFQAPLAGRRAWAGDSGGWITTIVELGASLANTPLRFRWRIGHDTSVGSPDGFEGWFLDDVSVTAPTCADTAPAITLTLEDDTASEFAPLDVAQFTISAPLPPIDGLPIPLLNSGTALLDVDVVGTDGILLPGGQVSVQVSIHAVNDSEVEGAETLVLAVDPASALVVTGSPLAAITIEDTPYGAWAAAALGLGTSNGPFEDFDGDRSLNLEEYVWSTDGASPLSFPVVVPRVDGDHLRLDVPVAGFPADVSVGAETSSDLEFWTGTGIEWLADGFGVPAGDPARYLRLVYQLIPAAPSP